MIEKDYSYVFQSMENQNNYVLDNHWFEFWCKTLSTEIREIVMHKQASNYM